MIINSFFSQNIAQNYSYIDLLEDEQNADVFTRIWGYDL